MAKLFLIAGHGAGDPGACGNGYSEAERVRVLAQKIKVFGGDQVMLGDISRDYYADNGISTLNIPKDYEIMELHMDAGVPTAKGGHVIINSGFTADRYDSALAAMLKDILPGRANMIVGRNDLANPARAAVRGYSYRLVEFGFITNTEDVRIFNTRMDDIARGVLDAFEIRGTSTGKTVEEGGKKNMVQEIWAIKGEAGQYYYDGCHLHPFATQREKDLLVEANLRITGVDLSKNVHVYSKEDFKNLKAVIGRIK